MALLHGSLCWVIVTASFAFAHHASGQQPEMVYVYENKVEGFHNRFVIGPMSSTSGGRYLLRPGARVESKRLTYKGYREFRDGRANTRPTVRGWLYEATDSSGIKSGIIFGSETLLDGVRFPVYYSKQNEGEYERWLTAGGTTRKVATLDDKVSAVLFAHQVESSVFPNEPFNSETLDPLVPFLAWEQVRPDLEKIFSAGLPIVLVRNRDGLLEFLLGRQSDAVEASLTRTMGFPKRAFRGRIVVKEQLMVLKTSEFKNEYIKDGSLDLDLVARGLTDLLVRDATILSGIFHSVEKRSQVARVTILGKPWQRILYPNDKDSAHYWRVTFSVQRQEGRDLRWEISTHVDIGKRPFSEPETHDRIEWFTTTADSPRYSLVPTVPVSERGTVIIQRAYEIHAIIPTADEPLDVEVVDVTEISKLADAAREASKLCRRKLLQ